MPAYRLYFFHPRTHGIVRFEPVEASDDEAALSQAQLHRGRFAMEMWDGTRKVGSIEAQDLASRVMAVRAQQPASVNSLLR